MTGEQQTPVSAPAQPAAQPAPQPAVTPQAPAQDGSQEREPMRDRTRENFEKLLESNNRLYEQNEMLRKEIQDRLAQAPAPQPAPQPAQAPQSEWDFYEVDPKTGETFINRDKLSQTMKELRDRTQQAEVQVQKIAKSNEEREIDRQNQEAFNAYPELNPGNKDKFDKRFHQQVRGMLYDSFLNPAEYGGRPVTFKEAADLVRGGQPTQPKAEPQGGQQQPTGQALKEAGAANVPSQPQNPTAPSNDEELLALRFATRMGNDEALARRLIHTEHILPRDAQQVDA